jgi:NAD(P)-dependent dehydrogenase (short-subunit alcohol dehydrogenase family)
MGDRRRTGTGIDSDNGGAEYMNASIQAWLVIGASRNLGAAFVAEFLRQTNGRVIGLGRTSPDQIENQPELASGRYQYRQCDLSDPASRTMINTAIQEFAPAPVGVIFNAAQIEKDLQPNHTINYAAFERVNQVNIAGLGNALAAVESYLLTYGGRFVGVSSWWGSVPPLFLPWMAYPASKAYLNSALRCLRVAWRPKVKISLVNLGNVGGATKSALPTWIVPTYASAARYIVCALRRPRMPKTINYPLWHAILYNYGLRFAPECFYDWAFRLYFALDAFRKKRS